MAGKIDTKNDALMIQENLRSPHFIEPNFSKTKEEKLALKKVKNNYTPRAERFKTESKIGRLTIHVMNLLGKKDFKTTYSVIIDKNEIVSYLNSHNIKNDNIVAMYFAGKMILSNKLQHVG